MRDYLAVGVKLNILAKRGVEKFEFIAIVT